VVALLFFMTGIAIILYLNPTPYQPRERDYAYACSFYAYAIWVGLGVLALFKYMFNEKIDEDKKEASNSALVNKLSAIGKYEILLFTVGLLAIGFIASIVSNLVVSSFPKGKIDDALDVFACHGVGGMVGMLLTGVFASKSVNAIVGDNQGLIYGDATLFLIQLKALVIVSIFAFAASYALFFIVNKITPLRVSEEKEELGLDISQHGEFL